MEEGGPVKVHSLPSKHTMLESIQRRIQWSVETCQQESYWKIIGAAVFVPDG